MLGLGRRGYDGFVDAVMMGCFDEFTRCRIRGQVLEAVEELPYVAVHGVMGRLGSRCSSTKAKDF